ncbi:hypothetical protein DFQ26_001970 [Actinomortierella ambigua]|nr:hypothetical protein DFQ26_001970 [Actinomortierella ambigua]
MAPPYIALMSRQRILTCHRRVMQGLCLLGQASDPLRQGCRRHHHDRIKFYTQQPRVSGAPGRPVIGHQHRPTTLSRHQYTTTTARSESALKDGSTTRKRFRTLSLSEEQDAKILEMRLEGAAWSEIGEALGIDAGACHYRYKKFLDPQLRVGWSEANLEKLNSMVAKRVIWNKIAIELNMAPHACREKWLEINQEALSEERRAKMEERRLERKKRLQDAIANGDRRETSRQRWTPTLDALLVELHSRGWTWRQIGRAFGVVPMACYNRYNLTLKEKVSDGWSPSTLKEEALPYFLRRNSGSRDTHASFAAVTPTDTSGQPTSQWNAMQQMTKILSGDFDATQQPSDNRDLAFPMQPAPTYLASNGAFPTSGLLSPILDPHSWSEKEDETIRQMHKAGDSFQNIARALGVKTRQVLSRFYTVLETDSDEAWTPEMLDRLDFYVRQGLSWATIGGNLGKNITECRMVWQELQRVSKPSSTTYEEDPHEQQSHLLGQEPQSASTLPSTPSPPEGVASSATSTVSMNNKHEQPSRQEQPHGLQHNNAWSEETGEFRSGVRGHGGEDMVDEYDNDDQDDHSESHEDDAYFEDVQDDEDDSRAMFDHERDVLGKSTGRAKSKSQAQSNKPPSSHSLPSDYWDQNAVLRAIGKHWTVDEETALIQHVLQHGPRNWNEISRKILDGRSIRTLEQHVVAAAPGDEKIDPLTGCVVLRHEQRFSPEECQAYWKHLDLPVRRQGVDVVGEGSLRWNFERDGRRMARFWRLWLENGSNFENIAFKLSSEGGGHDEDSMASTEDASGQVTADQCRQYFEEKTRPLRRKLALSRSSSKRHDTTKEEEKEGDSTTTEASKDSGPVGEGEFYRACLKLAKTLAEEPKFQWTKERSVKLQKLVRQRLRTRGVQVNWVNWKWVARHVGGDATPSTCSHHWRSLRQIAAASTLQQSQDQSVNSESPGASSSGEGPWTEQDVLLLEQGVRDVGVGNNAINGSSMFLRTLQRFYLPHHSLLAIQRKYFTLSDKAMEVTLEEYLAIMEAVDVVSEQTRSAMDPVTTTTTTTTTTEEMAQELYAPTSGLWDEVVKRMNKKHKVSGWTKAPTRRVFESSYLHYLHVMASTWTKDEDQDLLRIVQWLGREDWLSVARFFPARTLWECRLRWCSLVDEVDLSKVPSKTN